MKKLIVTTALIMLSLSVVAGEWWNQTHSLNEVSLLDCRIEQKAPNWRNYKRLASFSDIHSGMNDRKFKYQLMLNDGYFTNRYLKVEFELNSWNYELEDPETGEWRIYERNGVTTMKLNIDDHHTFSKDNIRSRNTHLRDLDDLNMSITNPSSDYTYRLRCERRY